MVENPPAMPETQETQVQSLEKETTTYSSILAWKIPWTEEAGGLQSMGLQREPQLSTEVSRLTKFNWYAASLLWFLSRFIVAIEIKVAVVGREEGGGFRMGNTFIPVADSFQYLTKPIQYCKV